MDLFNGGKIFAGLAREDDDLGYLGIDPCDEIYHLDWCEERVEWSGPLYTY